MSNDPYQLATFSTSLGWVAITWGCDGIRGLTLGHEDPKSAVSRLEGTDTTIVDKADRHVTRLAKRLEAFSKGRADSFLDIELDSAGDTDFTRRVIEQCRLIPRAETITYAELAELAGSPRAARAVGNVMANNRIPLIVPCHRVVAANSFGGYSAPRGLELKLELLQLEGYKGRWSNGP